MRSLLRHEGLLFCVALQFLTRIPVPSFERFDVAWLSQSLRWFPLVGVLVALLQLLVWWGASAFLPHAVAVAWMMGAGLLLTGGFHEDGWADVCDGMGGAYERERVLTIMKDSRVGAFGAMGLVWMLLSKWSALVYLVNPHVFAFGLLTAHSISRLTATALIVGLDHVGDAHNSKSKPLGNQMSRAQWLVSASMTLLVLLACMGVIAGVAQLQGSSGSFFSLLKTFLFTLVLSVMVAALCGVACAAYFKKRIGGYTGDCLGASQQVCELLLYSVVLACMPLLG